VPFYQGEDFMDNLTAPHLFRQQCYLNGKWCDDKNKKILNVANPATGQPIGRVPNMGATEVHFAIESAQRAWIKWRKKTADERSRLLRRWHDLIVKHADDLARIMTIEQGKPLDESKGEIHYAAAFVEWFAEEGKRVYGDIIPAPQSGTRILVTKEPVGVCGAITPWNFPAAMITRKAAPALAAGCVVIVKPASQTPFSALALADLADRAGLPAGVFNVITGEAKIIGTELCNHPMVRKVSFTGSTEVGRHIMKQSASTIKRISLELGGNAPFIVFDDADIDAAVAGAIACKFRNTGQTCVCANRILVQKEVYALFAEKLVAAVKGLRVGDGLTEGSQQGPMIDMHAVRKVEQHIADARSKGAQLLIGGKRHQLGGSFFEPTVLGHVTADMQIAAEETFGPVAPLFQFSEEQEALGMANDTEFGLAAYFYSQDLGRAWRVSEGLEYGIVGINTGIISNAAAPFGGVKQSGSGREGSKYGIDEYLEIKYLCMAGLD
jgi:succinate-semialdehyde dehydrogenase/glutarate-semialdehyde dehydrogenase